jgi:hypothetical protein
MNIDDDLIGTRLGVRHVGPLHNLWAPEFFN